MSWKEDKIFSIEKKFNQDGSGVSDTTGMISIKINLLV